MKFDIIFINCLEIPSCTTKRSSLIQTELQARDKQARGELTAKSLQLRKLERQLRCTPELRRHTDMARMCQSVLLWWCDSIRDSESGTHYQYTWDLSEMLIVVEILQFFQLTCQASQEQINCKVVAVKETQKTVVMHSRNAMVRR